MEEELNLEIVYSQNILEFVTVANEYILLVENAKRFSKKDFLAKLHKTLPLLYLKGILLPKLEAIYEEGNEKFVSEDMWFRVHDIVKTKIGYHDEYPEIYDPVNKDQEINSMASIADNLSDIYQDVKNFASLYALGNEELMHDAIAECKQAFEDYWGQILVNAQRAVHYVFYGGEDLDDEEDTDKLDTTKTEDQNLDTTNWILTQKQANLKKGRE